MSWLKFLHATLPWAIKKYKINKEIKMPFKSAGRVIRTVTLGTEIKLDPSLILTEINSRQIRTVMYKVNQKNTFPLLLLLLLSRFSHVRLCATPEMAAHQAPLSLGFSRQEHWSGLPSSSPMHESEKWKWSLSVVPNSSRPHGLQPTRLLRPWDFPGKSTGVGCHCYSIVAYYLLYL